MFFMDIFSNCYLNNVTFPLKWLLEDGISLTTLVDLSLSLILEGLMFLVNYILADSRRKLFLSALMLHITIFIHISKMKLLKKLRSVQS